MTKRLLLFPLLFFSICLLRGQNVTITGRINGFRHNHDCNNDGITGDNPDPRYKVWVGYNAGNFVQSTNGPGLQCGSPNFTYGANGVPCNSWNPGAIVLPTLTNKAATTYTVRMHSWESDIGTPCVLGFGCNNDNCNPNTTNTSCSISIPFVGTYYFACLNQDDVICGPTNIADINFWQASPCADTIYNGAFDQGTFLSMHGRCDGGDYGINQLILNWSFAVAPTITLQPNTAFGTSTVTICSGLPITIPFSVNSFSSNDWTLGRWVKWQVSSDGVTYTDIAGTLNGTAYTKTNNYSYTPLTSAVGTKWYRALASSECSSPTFSTLTTTTNAVKIIVNDGTGASCANNSCNIFYVDPNPAGNGNDFSGNGGPSLPYKTISKALSAANSTNYYIRVAAGSGTDNGVCNLINNVIVEGGYTRNGALWDKSSVNQTNITFTGAEFQAQTGSASIAHTVAFKSDAKSGWIVKDINITTLQPASFAADGRGMSNYGFLIINSSSNYTISRCNIAVGNGGTGSGGAKPAQDGNGGAGGTGGGGSNGCANSCNNCNSGNGGNGGIGGGIGSPTSYVGGFGVSSGVGGCDDAGNNGNSGAQGNTGFTGSTGSAGSGYVATTTYFTPGGQGGTGGNGGGGQGGGGGSGNAVGGAGTWCGTLGVCIDCGDWAGGAGGTGGEGGTGGSGGSGGGGAFGIWRYNSSSGFTATEVNVTVGSGGAGGAGGAGGTGLEGSLGTAGTSNACIAGHRKGGDGGKGGTGGQGGTGGAGVAGLSAAVTLNGTPSTLTGTINYPNNITIDYSSSARGTVTGKACRYSEIDLVKTLGSNWILPSGLSIVNDTRRGTSSYTLASSPIKVTTDVGGLFYDLEAGAGAANTFKNGLYITADTRSLPVISDTVSEICQTGTVNLSVTGWDETNIQERKWEVYDSTSLSPISGSPFTGTKSVALSGFPTVAGTYNAYIVKYKERHSCCGWSRPVFALIRVFPSPTAPVITPTPNQTTPICPGTTISAAINPGNTSHNCGLTYDYYYNGDLTFTYAYTPGTSISYATGVNSVTVRVRKVCDTVPASNVNGNCNLDSTKTFTWTIEPPYDRGTIDTLNQTGSLALCGTPTPTPNSIPFSIEPVGSGSFGYKWYYKDVSGIIPPDCPNYTDPVGTWIVATAATDTFQTYIPANGEVPAGHTRTYACWVTPRGTPTCGTAGWANFCRKITVFNTSTLGAITSGNQTGTSTLCASPTPTPNQITFSTVPSGSPTFTYAWYYRDSLGTVAPACPATGQTPASWGTFATSAPSDSQQTYIPSLNEVPAGHTRTYACYVTPSQCFSGGWASSCRQIAVLPSITTPTIVSDDQTLCASTSSVFADSIKFGVAPAGSGGYTYQWYYAEQSGTNPPSCPTTSDHQITSGENSTYNAATYVPVANEIPGGYSRSYGVYVMPAAGSTVSCGSNTMVGCRKITMLPTINYGTIATASAFEQSAQCYAAGGYDPDNITFSTTPSGAGSFAYQWYKSTTDTSAPPAGTTAIPSGWSAIAGATSISYNPPCCITQATNYAVQVTPTSPSCSGPVWATWHRYINFLPPLDRGHIDSTGEIICTNGNPAAFGFGIGNSVWPVGSGSFSYSWYRKSGINTPPYGSGDPTGWTIVGTNPTVDLTTLGTTTTYAVIVSGEASPDCDASASGVFVPGKWVITVNAPATATATPVPTTTSSGTGTTYCKGTTLTLINPTAGAGCFMKYQSSINGTLSNWTDTIPIIPTTSATAGTNVIKIAIRDSCPGSGNGCVGITTYSWSLSTHIVVWTMTTIPTDSICNGGSVSYAATLTVDGVSNATFTWRRDIAPILITTSGSLAPSPNGPLSSTNTYYYAPVNTSSCNSVGPQSIVHVVPDPGAPTATASPATGTYCSGQVLTLTSPSVGTGGARQCQVVYQTVTPSGTSTWSTTLPSITTTSAGTYTINTKTFCSGTSCDSSGITAFTWTIVSDPYVNATQTPVGPSVCEGASLSASVGSPAILGGTGGGCGTTYSFNSGTYSSTLSTYIAVVGQDTLYARSICSGGDCDSTSKFIWTVVAQPAAPTATQVPAIPSVCIGATLTLQDTVRDLSGGTGTCSLQYRTIQPPSNTTSSWAGPAIPVLTASQVGSYTIQTRMNCSGSGCLQDSVISYSWNVVADPVLTSTRTPNKDTVCAGQALGLLDIESVTPGAGNCSVEYQTTTPSTGTSGWSTAIPNLIAGATGTYTIRIHLNCDALGCNTTDSAYSWYVVPDPLTPSTSKLPNKDTVCVGQPLSITISTPATDGTGGCQYEYSYNGGGFTSIDSMPRTAVLGTNTITVQRHCFGSDCDISGQSTQTWIGVADPSTPSATQFPPYATICKGATLTLTGVTDNGGGVGTCNTVYQTVTPSTTSSWSTTFPTIVTTSASTSGDYTIRWRKACSGSDCDSSTIGSYTWTLVSDPTLSTLNNDTICVGGNTVIQTTVTGGTGNFIYIWQYSPNGTIWSTVVDSLGLKYSISSSNFGSSMSIRDSLGTAPAGSYYYRVFLVNTDSLIGCDAVSTTALLTIVSKPSLSNPTPGTQTICRGNPADTLIVTGSGGTTRPYSYIWYELLVDSVVNGTAIAGGPSNTYLPSSTDTGTFYYYVSVSQNSSGCKDTTNATAQVIVSDGATVSSIKTPNTAAICEGIVVSDTVTFSGGAGCADTIQYEYDSSGVWTNYTSGNTISTTGHTLVKVRAKRTCPGCPGAGFTIVRWGINDKPDPSSAHVKTDSLCGNVVLPYAILTAADPSPYTGTWSILSGPGTIGSSTSDSTSITGMTKGTPTTIRWFVDNSGCSDHKDTTITPSSTTMDTTIIALVNNCRNCMIKNGNTYTFFNNLGHIVAKILDYSSPAIELAQTEVCLDIMTYRNSSPYYVPKTNTAYTADSQPYLPRRWTISPTTTNSNSHVTLYFTAAEYNALQQAAVGTPFQFSNLADLRVTKFSGGSNGTFTPPPNFPATNGSAVLITPTPVFQKYPNKITGPDYSVEFDISNYSTFYVHPQLFPFAPLPVELVSFTGWNEGDVNRLQWITASEKNTAKFEVQKSLAAATWTTIGEKPGSGNSNQTRTYNLDDNNPVIGNNYYRLKIIDADGKFTYSNVINLPLEEAVTNNFVRVFPNPTGGVLNVEIQATGIYDTKIYVYDVVGKKVFDKPASMTRGMNSLQFDFSTLSKGPYILQFQDNDGKLHTTKFVKDE